MTDHWFAKYASHWLAGESTTAHTGGYQSENFQETRLIGSVYICAFASARNSCNPRSSRMVASNPKSLLIASVFE